MSKLLVLGCCNCVYYLRVYCTLLKINKGVGHDACITYLCAGKYCANPKVFMSAYGHSTKCRGQGVLVCWRASLILILLSLLFTMV